MGGPHNTAELFPCPIKIKGVFKSVNENAWMCLKVQVMSFSQCRNNRNTKNINIFFKTGKNVQVQLMSFYYINIETIGKWKNDFFFSDLKKYTSLF